MWNLRQTFFTTPAHQIVANIHSDDEENRIKAFEVFGGELALADHGLSLLIELLQAGRPNTDELEETHRAAFAMADSLVNYLFAVRQLLLVGYYPEVRGMLRDCHERMTRVVIFSRKEGTAKRFLAGHQISQSKIDGLLAPYLKDDPVSGQEDTFRMLRGIYKSQSEAAHPNLESLALRLPTKSTKTSNLAEHAGRSPLVGGLLSEETGKGTFVLFIRVILESCGAVGSFVTDESGSWHREFESLKGSYFELVDEIRQLL